MANLGDNTSGALSVTPGAVWGTGTITTTQSINAGEPVTYRDMKLAIDTAKLSDSYTVGYVQTINKLQGCGDPRCYGCNPETAGGRSYYDRVYRNRWEYDEQRYIQDRMFREMRDLWFDMNNTKTKQKELAMDSRKSIATQLANLEKEEDQQLLEKYNLVNADGSLTEEGEEVVLRRMMKQLKGDIVADLKKLEDKKKASKTQK